MWVRSAANMQNCQWCHPAYVEGGLGPLGDLAGLGTLEPGDQDVLRGFCDQPGKVSRAQYVADRRAAKRVRLEGTGSVQDAQHPLLEADTGEGPDLPEDAGEGGGLGTTLRNMAW